jgi:peptidyl-dipeptidase Dcp
MKRLIMLAAIIMLSISTYAKTDDNPFFSTFDTPFGVPPFDAIQNAHYVPAFDEGMKRQRAEIDAIVNNPAPPTFGNTVEALETSGELLTTVSNVFFSLNSSRTNEEMQTIAKEVAPKLSQHQDDILLNATLFKRIQAVYEQRDKLQLNGEQKMLLEKSYRDFVRGGANLDDENKARLRKINEELSVLSLQFGENVLKETNRFEMVLESKDDLAGLPDAVVSAAAEAAEERGHAGAWVFTLHKPSMIPFLQFSERRDLREKIFEAYIHMGDNNDELDNKKILSRIAALRVERANILGYKTYADFVLEENMAKTPAHVYELLNQIWGPALAKATEEEHALQEMVSAEGNNFELEPWDWWYYAEKVKKARYDLDDEVLKPYFQLENVRQGVFDVATKLYGITFTERTDIPVYHPDVKVFEVKEADGTHIGLLFTDYFPRESKRGGAWMGVFRKQSKRNGATVTPLVFNVGNFSKPAGDIPSLLNFDEVGTMFHEFGHALHGLLSNCTYERLSGTEVAVDFVELPSQIMENWATHPAVLKMYARHYKTGEPIPQDLIDKIQNARFFNQGFATTEYLAASFLDMDWHTLPKPEELDAVAFEDASLKKIGLIPEIVVRYRSPYFRHIFAGGYAAGYYSYIWAEVLDADAFQAFTETGLFDRTLARSFRENILARGGSEDPMVLYKRFRGAEPKIDALLERRGLR